LSLNFFSRANSMKHHSKARARFLITVMTYLAATVYPNEMRAWTDRIESAHRQEVGDRSRGQSSREGNACRSDEIRRYLEQHAFASQSADSAGAALTPEVRVIYLLPSDRQVHAEASIALENGIKHLQRWYAGQIGNGKTFALHNPPVDIIRSNHDEHWFVTNGPSDSPSLHLWFNSVDEASARFYDPTSVYAIYIDADPQGQATGGAGGVALLPRNDLLGMMGKNTAEPNVCRWVGGLGHELGHALGLPHPPECDSHQAPDNSFPCQSLMYFGYGIYPNTYLLDKDIDQLMHSPFIVSVLLSGPAGPCSDLLPFSVSFLTPEQTVTRGATANFILAVQGTLGYIQAVNLAASASPPDNTLTLSSSSNIVFPGASTLLRASTSFNTSPGQHTITVIGSSLGIDRSVAVRLNVLTGPSIDSVNYDGKKKVTISGSGFGASPAIVLNGGEVTTYINTSSDLEIVLKTKAKKLGLRDGDNTVQVITATGDRSNVYALRL